MDIIVNDFYGLDMATTKEYGFGGDALLLAEFAKPKFKDVVLDLCTGCGVVPVMMMANGFKGRVTAVDIQPGAIELCRWTAEKNGIEDRFFPVLADLNELDWPADSACGGSGNERGDRHGFP
jgi:tRNA1(Val) A37 N6-methylase TrmN6